MQRERRLRELEAAVGRTALDNIPDSEVDDYCNTCLGPRAYRRRLDAARVRLKARGWNPDGPGPLWPPGQEPEWPSAAARAVTRAAFVCRGCVGEGMAATIARVRREAGLP